MILQLSLLALAGLFAGYVNSVAGAGSLLSLPALIFTGLEPLSANATNRVAVLFQNITAIGVYRRAGLGKVARATAWLTVPAAVTAAIGAWVSTLLDEEQLRLCIAIAMMVFLALSLVPPERHVHAGGTSHVTPDWKMALGFAAIGFYTGFLQAGVGILILLYLSLAHGVNLVTANAMKVVLVLVLAAASLAMFVWTDAGIEPLRGLVLAAFSTLGAYLGARAAVARGTGFVRIVLVVVVAGSVAKLAWESFV